MGRLQCRGRRRSREIKGLCQRPQQRRLCTTSPNNQRLSIVPVAPTSSQLPRRHTREVRLASALAKQATAQREYELAQANQEVAEAHEEALAQLQAGSIALIGDVQSEGGNSARARQRSSTEMAVPPLPLVKVAHVLVFQGAPAHYKEQDGQGLLAGAGSETQGTTYLLQQNVFNANLFESHVTNSWQEQMSLLTPSYSSLNCDTKRWLQATPQWQKTTFEEGWRRRRRSFSEAAQHLIRASPQEAVTRVATTNTTNTSRSTWTRSKQPTARRLRPHLQKCNNVNP